MRWQSVLCNAQPIVRATTSVLTAQQPKHRQLWCVPLATAWSVTPPHSRPHGHHWYACGTSPVEHAPAAAAAPFQTTCPHRTR